MTEEPSPVLEKSQRVLDCVSFSDVWAKYAQKDTDAPITAVLQIPLQDWEDFGRPDKLTVTIVAGDTLNEKG
jgi:hypothetical protein